MMNGGYIERKGDGYEGRLTIDGVDISPITGVYFRKDGNMFLWLRRKAIMEYDTTRQRFYRRASRPVWETYMEKQTQRTTDYAGEFVFLRLRYAIYGMWDHVTDKRRDRMNLFVERMPMDRQTIIKNINKMRRHE